MFSLARLVPGRRCKHYLSKFENDESLAADRKLMLTVKHTKQLGLNKITRKLLNKKKSARMLGGKIVRPYRRGLLVIVDGDNEMQSEDIKEPFGISTFEDRTAVATGDEIRVYDLERERTDVFRNKWLAQAHSVSFSEDGNKLLVAATGYDTVMEFELKTGHLTWFWNGWDHGYAKSPSGVQFRRDGDNIEINNGRRFRPWYRDTNNFGLPTGLTTTHLNHAQYFGGDNICITLFHQGKAIVVNKKTGSVTEIIGGLLSPHGFEPAWNNEKIVTDTRRGRIIFFDKDFLVKRTLIFDIDSVTESRDGMGEWLQNVLPLCDGLYAAIDIHRSCLWIFSMEDKTYRKIPVPDSWAVQNVTVVDSEMLSNLSSTMANFPRADIQITDPNELSV